jgi:hypothetical protein
MQRLGNALHPSIGVGTKLNATAGESRVVKHQTRNMDEL